MSRYEPTIFDPCLRELLNLRNADDLKQMLALLPDVQLKAPREGETIGALAPVSPESRASSQTGFVPTLGAGPKTRSDSPLHPIAVARGLCPPCSTSTTTPTLTNVARPRRLRALFLCFLTWGMLVTEKVLPVTRTTPVRGRTPRRVGADRLWDEAPRPSIVRRWPKAKAPAVGTTRHR